MIPDQAWEGLAEPEWEKIFTREIFHADQCGYVAPDELGDGGEECDCYVTRLWDALATLVESPAERTTASGWFTIEAGAMVRGQLRREIERAAWDRGLQIRTDESKGFLESVYRFTVRGDDDAVSSFMAATQRWLKQVAS